ncbi:ras-related protein Rab-17-like [Osmerus eperlanus]|uniref:ras-related protein Rab-17-like n=1 Tax=Osmerus eperlanus TaxID=29151 RepID=UPI002E102BDC
MGEPKRRASTAAGVRPRGNTEVGDARSLRVKMVLLGSSGVGKSSLALRFSRDEFKHNVPTVGCAYLTQVVCVSDVTLRFEIWDTAGEEKYHSVTPLYYRGAHAALVVYDISKRDTFVRAQMWIKELEKFYIPGSTVLGLVGNKGDLSDVRQVSQQEGRSLAIDRGLLFMETSAMSGNQTSELLQDIALRVKRSVLEPSGVLSHWDESECVDLRQAVTLNPLLASCCPSVGP